MGFSGYDRLLCAKGHLTEVDVYKFTDKYTWVCHCGAPLAWFEIVDTTNDAGHPTELECIGAAETKKCPHCGMTRNVGYVVYAIPEQKQERW